ncbi:alpha/beta fold hydrolase [Occultella aeris]|uniref:Alpha/beta hydrolase family protein n=1 Tax=Occultella aeris TaxID=2761496 RepID=A0A7M4DL74_9MICO|nr:alpha/beta hydrolase [Occultella aeris]VZO37970.1 Alpha/beta hydrolase family protein [Occultella aeris]
MDNNGTHIVLVPGFWLGSWAWDDVAGRLRALGHPVTALTLPGLEPDAAAREDVRLVDQTRAIERAIDAAGPARVVLVAHSGAAVPATAALDARVEAVAHAVWVDTVPAVDGYRMNAGLEAPDYPLSAAWDEEFEQGSMRDLTDAQLETFRERAVPEPAGVLRDPVQLTDPRRLDVPGTVVCTAFTAAEYRSYAEQGMSFLAGLLEFRALDLVDLPTGHWPMWSRPAELAQLIADRA